MSHLLRVLVAVPVLAVPGVALAQCTKDTDCKGERVCERGACITPAERAPPPKPEYTAPPPPPPVQTPAARPPRPRSAPGMEGSWEARSRKNILTYHVASTLSGFIAGILLAARDPGLTILQVSFLYERALLPNLSLTASLTPNFWSDAAGTLPYCGILVGARYYVLGDAPAGWWAGGELGTLPLNDGPGVALEGGYQWLFDSGLMLGLAGGITLAGSQPPQIGIAYGLGVGGHVGWNF